MCVYCIYIYDQYECVKNSTKTTIKKITYTRMSFIFTCHFLRYFLRQNGDFLSKKRGKKVYFFDKFKDN